MKQYIEKSAVVAEIKRRKELVSDPILSGDDLIIGERNALFNLLPFIDTLEVKEVDITSMADDYYDALIKEAEMDVDMAGHCRLAYYNGCKDVLNKIQKGE